MYFLPEDLLLTKILILLYITGVDGSISSTFENVRSKSSFANLIFFDCLKSSNPLYVTLKSFSLTASKALF
jgi:hypothetical protein